MPDERAARDFDQPDAGELHKVKVAARGSWRWRIRARLGSLFCALVGHRESSFVPGLCDRCGGDLGD